MKRFLILLAIIGIVGYGVYYTFTSKSYELSREAEKLYNEGQYRDAFRLADQALNLNRLNRQAIALRPKLRRIVEGEDMLDKAKSFYEEGVNLGLEGKVNDAKLKMSQAYKIATDIPGLSPSKPEAKELMKKINRDMELIIERAPEVQYREAMKYVGMGDLTRAYEALSNIDPQNEKVQRKMSELAYQLGTQRYETVVSGGGNKGIVTDGIYWFSAVQQFDENYADAQYKISELKKLK
jgi:tetratricopeptide (TPR) repeat protein